MKEQPLAELYYEISRQNPPALSILPGETVRIETEDTFNGLVRKEGDHRDLVKKPQGNPQSGPIWVEGAQKGDTLAVHFEKIDARIGQAANDMTWARRGLAEFLGHDIPVNTRIAPVRDNHVWWSPTVALPYRPMVGTIACAPDFGSPTTSPAGDYGGNMDIKEVTEGNTVYLPVYVEGALLHLGDAHAAQGDGELCGTALEMPAVPVHRHRLAPAIVNPPYYAYVSDLVRAAVAVDHRRTVGRGGHVGLTALAGPPVEKDFRSRRELSVEESDLPVADGHLAFRLGIGVRSHFATVEPYEGGSGPGVARRTVSYPDGAYEPVLHGRAVVMEGDRLGPGRPTVLRAHQADTVVVSAGRASLQPVRPKPAARILHDHREVGPVDEVVVGATRFAYRTPGAVGRRSIGGGALGDPLREQEPVVVSVGFEPAHPDPVPTRRQERSHASGSRRRRQNRNP